MNQSEQVFLNSCELVLQQFSIKQKGFVYFVWRKGKKHIQSLKYQCSEQVTPMKQTLTLSLKTYSINGTMQKRYTNFSLLDADGRQIEHIKFDITQWRGQAQQKRITLGSCNLKLKVRRKVALQLQNFHRHSKTQIEQSSQQSDHDTAQAAKNHKKQQLNIKQELAKAKRQIQDFDYITNKLKNDRNFYITQNQSLRQKLSQIHEQYGDQISKIKNHYQSRIQIRESIYEQEIQQLISTFNSNFEINRALIESLIQQKYDYEAEIAEMKENHHDYIQKQEENYEGIIADFSQNKKQIQEEIKDCLNKISERQKSITDLKRQIQELQIKVSQTQHELNKEIQDHSRKTEQWQKVVDQKQTTIYKHLDEIAALTIQVQTKDFQIKDNQTTMEHYRSLIQDFEKNKLQMQKINHELQSQRYTMTVEMQRLKVTIEEQLNSIEFHKVAIDQFKEQDKIKQQEFTAQCKSLQALYNEKEQGLLERNKIQQDSNLQLGKQNYDLSLKLQEAEHNNLIMIDQNNILKNQNEQNIIFTDQIKGQNQKMHQELAKHIHDLNEQIGEQMSMINHLQAENSSLKDEIRQLQTRVQIDTVNLKKDYDELVDNKVRIYEDELDFVKKQRDSDFQNFQKLKQEYESEIATLIQRESKQNEEIQRMFRDQMEAKNKEFFELHENNKLMLETINDLKLRLEIAQQQKANLLTGRGGRSIGHDDEDMEIQQIQQQSDQNSDSQQESQESQSSRDRKKKKNKKNDTNKKKTKNKEKQKDNKRTKNKKKKKKQSSSQQSEQQTQKSQQSQEQSQILAKINDSPQKKQKNYVDAYQNKAASEKLITQEDDSPYKKSKNPEGNARVISIQIPEQHRRKKYSGKQMRSQSEKKKRKQSDSQGSVDNQKNSKGKTEIKQLQKQVKKLKKQIKQYERNESIHLAQIYQQQEQIKSLNDEIDSLIEKISKKDPKLARKISNQIEDKREEKSVSNKSRSEMSMRLPPAPTKEVQNMKNQNQYLKKNSEEKNRALINVQNQKNALNFKLQTLETIKVDLENRLSKYQSRNQSNQPKVQQNRGTASIIEEGLKRSVLQLQGKFMNEKQKAQQIKLQKNQIAFQKEQLENQNKRLNIKLQDIEDQIKRNQPSQSAKEMQKQLQESNRHILDLSKVVNSAKLQKQAFEQELRLLKKRYSQIIRASQQAETKAANLQRQAEDLRRKDHKNRRDIEQYTDDIKKYKEQIKQFQNDMNSLNTVQNQSAYERKKVMDQMVKLQDALSTKEFQVIKLTKQIQKFKQKIQQGQDIKVGKRNQLLAQRQRLQGLLIKAQKRIQQIQEQDKLLKQRIEILQRQNKRNLQDKKQTYGQKLRFYVEEISNIKQIVEEYQNQNARLKIQNSQFFEHNQILKISFEKLQMKYEQVVQNQEILLQELQGMKQDLDQITQQLNKRQFQLQANQITINNLRKQLDTERTVSKKKSDKLTAYQQLNEKYLYEIKSLRIKLSQYETNVNQNQLLTEKCQTSTKTIEQLENQLKNLHEEYTMIVNTYTYRKEDVQQAMKQLKQHEDKIKQEQITRVITQLDNTHTQKQASMEQQIIQLFNENSKLRLSLQNKNDQNSQNLIRIAELEHLPQKIKSLQRQRDNFQRTIYELSEQLKTASEQLRRVQTKLNESIRNQQGKGTQNVILSKKFQDTDKRCKDLHDAYNQLKKQQKKLTERMKNITDQKEKQVQKLNNEVQHYQNKILSLQLEVSRLKQNESYSSKDYVKKIKKLQQKIEEMGDTFKQHEQTLQAHYLGEIKKLEESLQKLSEQIQQKMQRIQELNEALIMLQQQNDDLVSELTGTRTQLAEENQVYTNDINSLRNQLRQAEQMYDANIKTLEQQMSSLSKQLTVLRYNRQSGSRLSGSGVDDKSAKRTEQKLRLRDKKIEQLKSQILMMQESITKLMKKQNTTENLSQTQIQKLRVNLDRTQDQLREMRFTYETDIAKFNEIVKGLKREIMQWRNKNQEKQLSIEQKDLEMQSMKVQLQTTKELYSQLQSQLQKRKTYLNSQMEEQSQLQAEIRILNLKINELTEKLQESVHQKKKIQTELKRKSLELKRLSQKLNQVQINYRQVLNSQQKKNSQIKSVKLIGKEFQQKNDRLSSENKKLKNQMALWQKQNHQLKQELEHNANSLNELTKKINQMSKSVPENDAYAKKYKEINGFLQKNLGISLEQFSNLNYWNDKLNDKDHDIQTLAEELQQLRFLFEHKNLEIDQLKRINYEIQMKTEDNDFVYKQLDSMRKLCDKLENEKKDAIFRQEALKIQLQNLIQSQNRSNITEKLENILQGYYDE